MEADPAKPGQQRPKKMKIEMAERRLIQDTANIQNLVAASSNLSQEIKRGIADQVLNKPVNISNLSPALQELLVDVTYENYQEQQINPQTGATELVQKRRVIGASGPAPTITANQFAKSVEGTEAYQQVMKVYTSTEAGAKAGVAPEEPPTP